MNAVSGVFVGKGHFKFSLLQANCLLQKIMFLYKNKATLNTKINIRINRFPVISWEKKNHSFVPSICRCDSNPGFNKPRPTAWPVSKEKFLHFHVVEEKNE